MLLLKDGRGNTATLGQRDERLSVSLGNGENVVESGGEGVVVGILDGDDVERTRVALDADEGTVTTTVLTLGDEDLGTNVHFDDVLDLAVADVEEDGVVALDDGVVVADGATVVGDDVGHSLAGEVLLDNLAELGVGLLGVNLVEHEAALDVVHETEAVDGVVGGGSVVRAEGDNVHETSGEVGVSADLAVNLDELLHDDLDDLTAVQGVLQAVAKDDDDGEALAQLVGAGGGAGSPGATHLVKHPVLGRDEALKVLLGTASLNRQMQKADEE